MASLLKRKRLAVFLSFFLLFVALSYISTMYRVAAIGRPQYLYVATEATQLEVHYRVMDRTAAAPYQYRILSEYILELFLQAGDWAGFRSITAMILFKMLLHFFIFSLAYVFFRRLGFGVGFSLFGVAFIFYAIFASYYNEDLNFYQYLDFVFFLSTFLLLLKKLDVWLIPLVFLAALNKETAIAIPFLYLVNRLEWPKGEGWRKPGAWGASIFKETENRRRVLILFSVLLLVSAGVYGGLRLYFGTEREYITTGMQEPGWGLLQQNFRHLFFYVNWLVFFNFLLLAPWPQWRRKPAFIKRSSAVLVPFLVLGNLLVGTMAEVRVFFPFVPLLLAAGMLNVERWLQEEQPAGAKPGD